jgi:hypothetical protein
LQDARSVHWIAAMMADALAHNVIPAHAGIQP